jgi:hypothetical protein
MDWVKRNLYFLVGGVVAIALLGLAGYYLYSKWTLNTENEQRLSLAYADLKRISLLNPNPGNDKVNNTQIAREQEARLTAIIEKQREHFAPIPPVPAPVNNVVTKEEFASALRRTIDELDRAAAAASVTLPSKYSYSFEAQRSITTFAPGLERLAEQLGEVKTICNILFNAKINALDNLRRARVSDDDQKGPQSDYLDPTIAPVTNELAVLTPYEVTFRCFSGELATVLAGFANAPYGFIVTTINVESGAMPAGPGVDQAAPYPAGAYGATPYSANPYAATPYPANPYGANPAGETVRYGGYYPAPAAPVTVTKGGLPVILDEKQLRVNMIVNLVRLLPRKK